MSDPWAMGGSAALQTHAPAAAAALAGLVATWPPSVSEVQLRTLRDRVAAVHGLTPLQVPLGGPRRGLEVPEPALLAFADQFALDVSRLGHPVRSRWLATVGEHPFDSTFTVYVADLVPRVRAALEAVFGDDVWFDAPPSRTLHARLVLDEFQREVTLLDRLDPVTTELVRLRVARHHRCRVCMSHRSLAAVYAGADAATFAAVDDHRGSALTQRQQAALALTDAIVAEPARIERRDVTAVREHLSTAETVELVLDVMAFAANKITVALDADQPEVEGVQLFEIDEDGTLHFP